MAASRWGEMYVRIAREFGYDMRLDYESAVILDSVLGGTVPDSSMAGLIKGRTVFVVGSGPSLGASIPILKRFKGTTKIAADSAARHLIKHGIAPEIVVTDLDGHADSLKRCSGLGAILVVHAHGDNISKLYMALGFRNCIGTTQAEPYGAVQNFGGFTDGDRSVFLASHFGAKRIILFGMDYDGTVGRFSGTKKSDVALKLKKLEKSREALEWLSGKTESELFTTSSRIPGFRKIKYGGLGSLV